MDDYTRPLPKYLSLQNRREPPQSLNNKKLIWVDYVPKKLFWYGFVYTPFWHYKQPSQQGYKKKNDNILHVVAVAGLFFLYLSTKDPAKDFFWTRIIRSSAYNFHASSIFIKSAYKWKYHFSKMRNKKERLAYLGKIHHTTHLDKYFTFLWCIYSLLHNLHG